MKLIDIVQNDPITPNSIRNIMSDRYPSVNSTEFLNYLSNNNINITFTAASMPQSNGLIERMNQTLIERL